MHDVVTHELTLYLELQPDGSLSSYAAGRRHGQATTFWWDDQNMRYVSLPSLTNEYRRVVADWLAEIEHERSFAI